MDPSDIERLWPLSRTFEYAAEIGLEWRMAEPRDWAAFERDVDLDRLPMTQAQGFAFLQWLEGNRAEELSSMLPLILAGAPSRLLVEFQASIDCIGREHRDLGDPDPLPRLSGEPVTLFAPRERLLPLRKIDDWTKEALTGATIEVLDSGLADLREMRHGHSVTYLQGLRDLAAFGGGWLTPETVVEPGSWEACRAGAGALISAADYAARHRRPELILCRVRPGSHHAERGRGGGTCLVNNLANAARRAVHRASVLNAAVLDIDAHHGNGTEQILYEERHVRVASVHQAPPFFPGTGGRRDRGHGKGRGMNLNIPLEVGDAWGDAVKGAARWALRQKPAMLFVELSTDAHRSDPVSDLAATDDDFREVGRELGAAGLPVICELGSSLSRRAWIGGIRSFVAGFAEGRDGR